jgi:hypothetical protein
MRRETLEIGKIEICLINLGEGPYPGGDKDLDKMVSKKLGHMGENEWRFPTKGEFSYIANLIYDLRIINHKVLESFEKYWSGVSFTLNDRTGTEGTEGLPYYIDDLLLAGIEIDKSDPITLLYKLHTKSGKPYRIEDWEWYPSSYREGPAMGRIPEARYIAVRDI